MKKLLLLFTLISVTGFGYGQTDYPEVVPPAPSVASLMRFEEVPVDYYTGQPNISIPLGNVLINKDLSYPIALQYNTQGIRIEERSGWTGTGFSMGTGGVISRTIQGIPDELNDQYGGIGIFHLTEMMDYYGLSQADKTKFLWETNNGETKKDAMYDLFQYSFFGNSGRFIIEKTVSGLEAKIIGNETNHKIQVFHDSSFNLTKFEITDTRGYIYTFDVFNQNQVETVTITSVQYPGQGSNVSTSTTDMTGNQDVPNAWYLTSVKSPVKNTDNAQGTLQNIVLCTFTYSDVTENYNIPTTFAINSIVGTPNYGANTTTENTNKGMTLPKTVEVTQQVTSTQKYISSMTTRDGAKVEYSFSSNHPEYLLGGGKLNSIIIREPNGDINKEILLTYQTNPHDRLFLTQVKEKFGADELVYDLEYNDKNTLPAFDKSQQDQWGYYKDNPDPFLADPNDAATGALTAITYPTGGRKEFVFESNSYAFIGDTPVSTSDIPTNYTTVSYGDQFYYNNNMQMSPSVSSDKYVVYIDGQGSIDLLAQMITDNATGNSEFSFAHHKVRFVSVSPNFGSGISTPPTGGNGGYNPNDFYNNSGTDYEFDINFGIQPISVSTGWYMIEIYTPQPFVYQQSWNFTIEIAVKVREFILNSYNQLGGGIRVKEVIFKDKGDQKRKIEYSYNENHHIGVGGALELKSSGSFEYDQNNRSYTRYITHPFVDNSCGANQINIVPQTIQYQMSISRSQSMTPNTKGNYVGYKHVVRRESGNGWEEYTYISPRDEQILTSQNTSYPFKPADNLDYKRGVLSKKEIVDETDRVLEQETYLYTDINNTVKTSVFPYEASLSGGGTCAWDQFYLNYTNYLNKWVDTPITSCGFASGGPNTYDNCDTDSDMAVASYNHTIGILLPNTVTKTQFYYDGTNTTPSNTVVTTQKMTYNSKFRVEDQITEIEKAGVIEELKKETYYPYNIPSGSGFTTTELSVLGQMNSLNIIANPVMTISRRGADILSTSRTSFANFSTNNFRPSKVVAFKGGETDKKQIDFHDYDDYGNLIEVSKEEGTQVVYIWGYDGTLPIAKIENAKITDIPTSIYNDVVNKSNLDHTGNTTITENNLRTALETLRNHSSMVNAMVTTLTYDPLIGLKSITDPRGESIFYEYDNLHRLKFVRDAYGNIVSSNQYKHRN